MARLHNERTGYPTQKPNALLERIILASSNPRDLVADFFCGSGTTPFVAVKHGRRFIATDENLRAIQTTRARLIESKSVFSMESNDSANFSYPKLPKSTKVKVMDDSVALDTKLDLDFWEIDPDWDGGIFRSAAQAKRPMRSGDIPKELKIKKIGRRVCIRFVTASGRQYQLDI